MIVQHPLHAICLHGPTNRADTDGYPFNRENE